MAPLPSNTTNRLKCTYSGPLGEHTLLFRAPDGESEAGLVNDARNVISAMGACQYDGTTWGTAEYSEAGSDLFFPESDWEPIVSESGINPGANSGPSTFLEFGGRSMGGRRVKYYLFETYFQEDDDMKYDAGDSVLIDEVIVQLGRPESEICAIDGLVTTFYTYANIGQNDYLTHRARRS